MRIFRPRPLLFFCALFFGLLGGIIVYFEWPGVPDKLQNWVAVSAAITQVTASEERTGGRSSGCFMTIKLAYSYEFAGKHLISRRLDPRYGRFSCGKQAEFILQQLTAARDSKKPVEAWVNPLNPAEAMIFREHSELWSGSTLLILLVIWGACLGTMWLSLRETPLPNAPGRVPPLA